MSERFDTIIVGAGLAGAFSAFWLSKCQHVLLLEARNRPAGASQVAAGIVNPFAGMRSRLIWRGLQALESLEALVAEVGAPGVYNQCGVLRPCASVEQAAHFHATACAYPQYARWYGSDEARSRYSGVASRYGALRLFQGGIIRTPTLIDATLAIAARRGATVKTETAVKAWGTTSNGAFVTTRDGMQYLASRVLLCLGSRFVAFAGLRRLNLHRTKGQVVRVIPPHDLSLPMPISGHGYVAPVSNALLVGTTYEHRIETEAPTDAATRIILQTASTMVPSLMRSRVHSAMAGIRVSVPGTRLPMVGPIADKIWIFTGLGSKGLLYAALISRMLPDFFESSAQISGQIMVTYANSM